MLYVASGTYIISNVVDRTNIPDFKVNQTIIRPNKFVVESKTWFYESDNEEELNYLCSILNSKILSKNVKDLQTRGLWGVRDIHRRPLLYTIPLYDPNNKDHMRLAEISKELHKSVQKVKTTFKSIGIRSLRRRIQKILTKELEEIDELVKKILNF